MISKAQKMLDELNSGKGIHEIPHCLFIVELFDWTYSELIEHLEEATKSQKNRANESSR